MYGQLLRISDSGQEYISEKDMRQYKPAKSRNNIQESTNQTEFSRPDIFNLDVHQTTHDDFSTFGLGEYKQI